MLSARVWLGWGPPALYLELVCMSVHVCACAHLNVHVSFWMLLRTQSGLFQGGLGEAGHGVGNTAGLGTPESGRMGVQD